MDETALMCVGVLLEEYMQAVLGDTGDLVFVEAGEEKEGSGNVAAQDANRKLGFEHEDGRRAEETEELVEQESDEEESPSDTTETEDEHRAPTSSEGESTENGRPRKRAKIVK